MLGLSYYPMAWYPSACLIEVPGYPVLAVGMDRARMLPVAWNNPAVRAGVGWHPYEVGSWLGRACMGAAHKNKGKNHEK